MDVGRFKFAERYDDGVHRCVTTGRDACFNNARLHTSTLHQQHVLEVHLLGRGPETASIRCGGPTTSKNLRTCIQDSKRMHSMDVNEQSTNIACEKQVQMDAISRLKAGGCSS